MNSDTLLPPSKRPKRFFDIAPPDTATPSATSKPVIVSNRPEQADPMVHSPAPQSVPSASIVESAPVPEPQVAAAPDQSPAHPVSSFEQELVKDAGSPDAATKLMLEEYKEVEHEIAPHSLQTVSSELPQGVASETSPAPAHPKQSGVVAHHVHKSPSLLHGLILWLLVLVSIAVLVNILLDAGVWQPSFDIPHTDFFQEL